MYTHCARIVALSVALQIIVNGLVLAEHTPHKLSASPSSARNVSTNKHSLTAQLTNSVSETRTNNISPTNRIDITTRNGKIYTRCKIMRVTPHGIKIMHSAGVTEIAFTNMPDEIQAQYGYTREKEAAYNIRAQEKQIQAAIANQDRFANRQTMIESGFSAWNGSHIALTRIIKKTMNDPGSYKHSETTYFDAGDYLIVNSSFRGKNAFGGTVINSVKAKCSLDGQVLEILETYP